MQVLAVVEHLHFLFPWLVLFVFTPGNDSAVSRRLPGGGEGKGQAEGGLEPYVREGRVI